MSLGTQSLGFASLGLVYGSPRTLYGFAILSASPNWGAGITEKLAWSTSIIESFNGTEQRLGRRDLPRRTLSYSVLLTGAAASELENLLYGSPDLQLAVPSWPDVSFLTASVLADASVVFVDTATAGFRAGGYALLYASPTKYEILQISSMAPDRLFLTESAFYSWPKGSKAFPLNFVEVELPVRLTRMSADVVAAPLSLHQLAGLGSLGLPSLAAPAVYKGLEVFAFKHNWRDTPSYDIEMLSERVDATVGRFRRVSRGEHSTETYALSVLLKSRAEVYAFKGFLARAKGRLATLWLPTQAADFTLIATTGAASRILTVAGQGFPLYSRLTGGRNHVRIQHSSGQVFYRELVAANILSGNTELEIDSALGVAMTPDSVKKIDIIVKARLASDDIEIKWLTASVAECALTFRSLI